MDSKDKGESRTRQHQESLARRVGQALDQLKPGEARDCPDAEIIAAYSEQALAPDETAQWEGHFATCARCRNVLRVLAASSDAPLAQKEVSHLGELVSKIQAPVAIDSKAGGTARPNRSAWRTRWLAPAIGVAAVLIVWLAMRPPWRATNQGSSQVLVAQAPKEELPQSSAPQQAAPPPAADQALKDTQAQDQKAPAREDYLAKALPPDSSANAPAAAGAVPGAEAGVAAGKASKVSPSVAGAANAVPEKKAPDASSNERQLQASAPPSPPAPPPPSPAVPHSTAQSVIVTEAAPTIETTNGALSSSSQPEAPANLPLNGRNFQSLSRVNGTPGNAVLLKPSSGASFWRAGKGGLIERSTDAGKTWVSQMSPSQQDWLAGAPFSDTVCWLAGRKGAIARTVDGEHWDLIPPPTQSAGAGGVQPDWIGISALDALSATVTSADGRKFTTSDGGLTWQRQ